MIKLIVGAKGSGKTKTMIDMINNATKTTSGNIVVIRSWLRLIRLQAIVLRLL